MLNFGGKFGDKNVLLPITVAAGLRRGSAGTCLLGLRARIPQGHKCLSLVSVVCCQMEVCASGRSLAQRSCTECCVSESDREVTIMRRPTPTRTVEP